MYKIRRSKVNSDFGKAIKSNPPLLVHETLYKFISMCTNVTISRTNGPHNVKFWGGRTDVPSFVFIIFLCISVLNSVRHYAFVSDTNISRKKPKSSLTFLRLHYLFNHLVKLDFLVLTVISSKLNMYLFNILI